MQNQPVGVQIRASHPHFHRLLDGILQRDDIQQQERSAYGVAAVVLDFPQTWAFEILEDADSVGRARTLVVTQSRNPAYLDCLGSYHVSGVVSHEDERSVLSGIFAAAACLRTYHRKAGLTYMELRVLRMLLQGHDTNSAADELSVSYKTINAHVSNVLCKLDLASRAQLVARLLGCALEPSPRPTSS